MEGKDVDGMLTTSSARATVEAWLGDFGAALTSGEAPRIAALFAEDCHWRDLLAFTSSAHRRHRLPHYNGPDLQQQVGVAARSLLGYSLATCLLMSVFATGSTNLTRWVSSRGRMDWGVTMQATRHRDRLRRFRI
jgi:hypothetical protein